MINPVIFSFKIANFTLTLRWYGVIVMIGVIVASLIVERELRRRGENGDRIWDALVWILPIGIIGARLWFVVNATLGGNHSYIDDPTSILRVWEGGLHIFGGFLFGAAALIWYLRRNNLDPWLFLDSAGPAMLIGQAIGRLANFINQELYGPPTTLPWGIPISQEHRLPQFAGLPDTTRFHPTFAYEMIWNVATASLLLWLSRRYEKQIKPGTIFAGWLLAAGLGRTWIEIFFRPDQPKIGDTGISYSAIISALMAVAGAILLMIRYKAINGKLAETWEDEYQIAGKAPTAEQTAQVDEATQEEEEVIEKAPRARKASTTKARSTTTKQVAKTSTTGKAVRTSASKKSTKASTSSTSTRTTRTKKSSF